MLRTEGAERQAPNMTAVFAKNLEIFPRCCCPTKNLPPIEFLAYASPIQWWWERADICPSPEIWAPKVGAWYEQCMRNFFPFFGMCTPFLKYYRSAKFSTGALPPSQDMAKKLWLYIICTPCPEKKRPKYFSHNFDKFRQFRNFWHESSRHFNVLKH